MQHALPDIEQTSCNSLSVADYMHKVLMLQLRSK